MFIAVVAAFTIISYVIAFGAMLYEIFKQTESTAFPVAKIVGDCCALLYFILIYFE